MEWIEQLGSEDVKEKIRNKTFKFKSVGEEFIGIFIERKVVDLPSGPAITWVFKDTKDTNINYSIWGSAVLNDKLRRIKDGTLVRITYLGKKPTKKNPMWKYNDFKIEFGMV